MTTITFVFTTIFIIHIYFTQTKIVYIIQNLQTICNTDSKTRLLQGHHRRVLSKTQQNQVAKPLMNDKTNVDNSCQLAINELVW